VSDHQDFPKVRCWLLLQTICRLPGNIRSVRSFSPLFNFFTSLLLLFFIVSAPSIAFGETTVLILGDSLTAGFGVEKEEAFPFLVEQRLINSGYKNIKIINAGFSGSTTASALKRMQWYLKLKPDILLLELGANDGLRGHPIESIRNNLEKTILFAQGKKMKILLAGMKIPTNYGTTYTKQFENIFFSLARDYPITLIPFLLEGVAGIRDLNLADGIHPNPQGHVIVAETVFKYLHPVLMKTNSKSSGK
jgi:acyl-CoA thioesterase I